MEILTSDYNDNTNTEIKQTNVQKWEKFPIIKTRDDDDDRLQNYNDDHHHRSWFMVHQKKKKKKKQIWTTEIREQQIRIVILNFFVFDWPYAQFQSSGSCYWWLLLLWRWKLNFIKKRKKTHVNTRIMMISCGSDDSENLKHVITFFQVNKKLENIWPTHP